MERSVPDEYGPPQLHHSDSMIPRTAVLFIRHYARIKQRPLACACLVSSQKTVLSPADQVMHGRSHEEEIVRPELRRSFPEYPGKAPVTQTLSTLL